MKAIFGVVSLLIVLAIGGVVMTKQLKAVGQVPLAATDVAAAPDVGAAASGNAREQSQQLQQKVRDDVAKALEQGAQNTARGEEATR